MIKQVIKYVDSDYKWQDHEKLEEAKDAAKRRLVRKFVSRGIRAPDESWRYTWAYSTKIAEAKKAGFREGWYQGQSDSEDRIINFLPEITAGLKAIEEQPIEEVKND